MNDFLRALLGPCPELEKVLNHFCLFTHISKITQLNSGNVNLTFLVELNNSQEINRFILQRLNKEIFREPLLVMDNLEILLKHINTKFKQSHIYGDSIDSRLPTIIYGKDNTNSYFDNEGHCWRAISYIENSIYFNSINCKDIARKIGSGLGEFHFILEDMNPEGLSCIVKNFHSTSIYLDRLFNTYKNYMSNNLLIDDYVNNARIDYAYSFISKRVKYIRLLEDAVLADRLIPRTVHGDPKVNNFIFDSDSRDVICLIDLDTVQSGLYVNDIADCARSCCNPAGEEVDDLDLIYFDVTYFEEMISGYMSNSISLLSEWDFYYLPYALRLITLELGIRFLTDYLSGNKCFTVVEPSQNLSRAEVQFRLLQSVEEQSDRIASICKTYCHKIP